jgi:uncharacterized protein
MLLRIRDLQTKPEIEISDTLLFPQVVTENVQVEAFSAVEAHATVALQESTKIKVHGTVAGEITYQCSRCLSSEPTPFHSSFTEWFTTSPAKADEEIHLVVGDQLDLDPFFEETVVLAIEYRPLCQKGCKGLCPTCGVNWNETSCKCDNRTIDPRLGALKDLLSADETE